MDEEDDPFPDRPRLRYIDEHLRPDFFNLSKRYTLAILVNFGFALLYMTRSNVCLLRDYQAVDDNWDDSNNDTGRPDNLTIAKYDFLEFQMDTHFLLSYILVQIPAGIVAYKYSGVKFFGICILLSSIITFMTPILEIISRKNLLWAAFFQGFVQGAAIPASQGVWRHWAPPLERTTLVILGFSGTYFGIAFGTEISECFCSLMRWTTILYFYGLFGVGWYFAWLWLVFERPSQHPTISEQEILYLKQTVGSDEYTPPPPIQWRKLFSSGPVLALFAIYLIKSCNPYMMMQNDFGQYSYASPYGHDLTQAIANTLMACGILGAAYFSDRLLEKTSLSLTRLRRMVISGSIIAQSVWLLFGAVVVGWTGHPTFFIICYLLELVLFLISQSNYFVNHLEVTHRLAPVTMGIANFFSGFISLSVLETEGAFFYISDRNRYLIFVIPAILYFICGLFYAVFGSAEVQPWSAEPGSDPKQDSNEPRTVGFENIDSDARRILIR